MWRLAGLVVFLVVQWRLREQKQARLQVGGETL